MEENDGLGEVARISAILGILVVSQGGEVRIPFSLIEEGLPSDSGIKVETDDATDELVLRIGSLND